MCGIVGAITAQDISKQLIDGLKKLEYRGYDSAGLAVINSQQTLERVREKGKVSNLEASVQQQGTQGNIGIAHTRWATHGAPTAQNAHPHTSGTIAVVHNGIIENHEVLRSELKSLGYVFTSETDTEVIAHLVHSYITKGKSLIQAIECARKTLHGAYGMAVIDADTPEQIAVARSGSPLVIGKANNGHYLASDQLAISEHCEEITNLEEGDIALITADDVAIYNDRGEQVIRNAHQPIARESVADKGSYRHFMLKEIHEQPGVVQQILDGRISSEGLIHHNLEQELGKSLDNVESIYIIACGTSYHAGMVAKYWIEDIVGIPCQVEIASEFRYRKVAVAANSLLITISQSGETADTLAALRVAKERGFQTTLTVCNSATSSLVRESDHAIMTRAGTEIGVASTKAFTAQLTTLFLFTLKLAVDKGLSKQEEITYCEELHQLPINLLDALAKETEIDAISAQFIDKQHALFLGRGIQYPIAMEGALKIKEISYIHAESYAAGELKHGPLALIDESMPVVSVAPNDSLLDKLRSNLEEVRARGGELFIFAEEGLEVIDDDRVTVIGVPKVSATFAPLIYNVHLQLLSYYVALHKGTDIDQPRNLAKSVTVE